MSGSNSRPSRRALTPLVLAALGGLVAAQSDHAAGKSQSDNAASDVRCADGVIDAANPANCIEASSIPTLGSLYPMSQHLFVSPSGLVGIGTTTPFRNLEVVGTIGASSPGSVFKAVMRPSNSKEFGILETISSASPLIFPTVTNLISTVSIDPAAGALATLRDNQVLTALTTAANDSKSGFVSVRSNNVEIAGINGNTGTVFGASKSFVQPHPQDPTKEIQYVSLEGPEHGVYTRGTGRLVGGVAYIELPEDFSLVASEEGLTVNVTPSGPNSGLYVSEKSTSGFVVQENAGGAGVVAFDYVVMGQRSAMPRHVAIQENTHFVLDPEAKVPAGSLPGEYRRLMIQNGLLNADGSVNAANASRLALQARGGASGGRASAPVARD